MKKLFFFLALATGFASANAQLSVTITGSTTGVPLSATAAVSSNFNGFGVSCAVLATGPNANGTVLVTVTGGSANFTYDLFTGTTAGATGAGAAGTAGTINKTATTHTFGGLLGTNGGGSSYTAKVTDVNGCVATIATPTVVVTAPANLTASIAQTLGDLCQVNGGSATVTIAGGVANYTFATVSATANTPFSGPAATPVIATATNAGPTNVATGLSGNSTYVFSITDANGCVL